MRVAGLRWHNSHVVWVCFKFAILLLLHVAVHVFDKQVLEHFLPAFYRSLPGFYRIIGDEGYPCLLVLFIKVGSFFVDAASFHDITLLEALLNRPDILDHVIVFCIGPVGNHVKCPEGGGGGEVKQIAVSYLVSVGNFRDAAIHGGEHGGVGVVKAEPEDPADRVGQPAA